MSADIRLPGAPVPLGNSAGRAKWSQRRLTHGWIVGVIAGVLFAAAAVALYFVFYNIEYAVVLDAATTMLGQS